MGEVTFLGTGDPLNGERMQTCLALRLALGDVALLDTGSGTSTLAALSRSRLSLESIRHLFITHRHFDHAGGLAPLLVALTALPEASLTIPGVEDWLGGRLRWNKLSPGEAITVGDAEMTPFEVDHGIECVGLRISQGGHTLIYAADTRPTVTVVRYAKEADLLVHEAYGTEREAEQAHRFGHSTAADAGKAALDAGAKRLVLTHLRASRFADPTALEVEATSVFGGPVEVADDLGVFDF